MGSSEAAVWMAPAIYDNVLIPRPLFCEPVHTPALLSVSRKDTAAASREKRYHPRRIP
jgi:hypothetical protein